MKLEDRVINEGIEVLDHLKDTMDNMAKFLASYRASLVDLLEDKSRCSDCAFWRGDLTLNKWGGCEYWAAKHPSIRDPINGLSAACQHWEE